MKNIVFNMILAAIIWTFLAGCSRDLKIFKAEEGKDIYIGKVKEKDGIFNFRIAITNNSTDTLFPLGYRSLCRCISADVKREAIPPGSTNIMDFSFNPAYKEGKVREVMRIIYVSGIFMEIAITADVIPATHPIEEEHPYFFGEGLYLSHKLLHYGIIEAGDSRDIYFHIANGQKNKARIELIPEPEEYGRYIKLRQPGLMRADGRDTIHVKFTIAEDAPDTISFSLQPYVNGARTEEKLTVLALTSR